MPACFSQLHRKESAESAAMKGSGTIFTPCPLFMMEKQPAKFHTSNPREQACLPSDAIRRA